jgi:glycosyltransferase involved in cell wall biosynthesis
MHLLFDITLLVTRPWLGQPSGIDRVELAHAKYWRQLPQEDVVFVCRNAWNRMAAIPDFLARALLEEADTHIASGMTGYRIRLRARTGLIMAALFFGLGRTALFSTLRCRPDSVFLTVSNANLHHHSALADLNSHGCRIVPLVHDIIPLTHPQYVPEIEHRLHKKRIAALARFSDAGIIVSQAALDELKQYALDNAINLPPMTVAHPGLDLPTADGGHGIDTADPYFLILGTVEPRKNHIMLLNIWQEICNHPNAPRLIIIGRLSKRPHPATLSLERNDFRGRVEYRGRLNDREVAALLKGASALLFPSIIEGFGIPLAEAFAAGIPAIVSDIPAFREHGCGVPEFIDPLDGPTWKRTILDYADPQSLKRAAQISRMQHWTAPSWQSHFTIVEKMLRHVAVQKSAAQNSAAQKSISDTPR